MRRVEQMVKMKREMHFGYFMWTEVIVATKKVIEVVILLFTIKLYLTQSTS